MNKQDTYLTTLQAHSEPLIVKEKAKDKTSTCVKLLVAANVALIGLSTGVLVSTLTRGGYPSSQGSSGSFNTNGVSSKLATCQSTYADGISISNTVFVETRANSIENMASTVSHNFSAHPGLSPVVGGSQGQTILQNNNNTFFASIAAHGAYVTVTAQATQDRVGPNFVKTIDDYQQLYSGLETPGIFKGNWKTDAYFGRSRLTFAADYIKQVKTLPFSLSAAQATKVGSLLDAGVSLQAALTNGNIYTEDHSDLASSSWNIKPSFPGRYLGFSTGIFYYSAIKKSLVPLAIRMDVNGLIVTPKDGAEEWLLGKIMLNAIAMWRAQWVDHFTENHFSIQPLTTSAFRTMAVNHPVYVMVQEATKMNAGIIAGGFQVLLAPGTGSADMNLPFNSQVIYNANVYR
jgi:hypothetical protein